MNLTENKKEKKILDAINDMRKLDDTQLDIVIDCIKSSLKVQYLLGLKKNNSNPLKSE